MVKPYELKNPDKNLTEYMRKLELSPQEGEDMLTHTHLSYTQDASPQEGEDMLTHTSHSCPYTFLTNVVSTIPLHYSTQPTELSSC